jgi:energy-coupling factor transporter ATP-binding protein EcfA2
MLPRFRWRLHRVRCVSVRGVAPISAEFVFDFEGSSVLLYGGNGSGKSSLLNVVCWVLTGRVVTDGDDDADEIPLYAPPKPGGRAAKLCEWPVVHTLPDGADALPETPDCWAELRLQSADKAHALFLRRSLRGSLEESDDGVGWRPCASLARHGIAPLDIQLSVSAATMFGRQSIENSAGTRNLLSMMLGYDALEGLGDLITTLAGNLTKAAKSERESTDGRRERLQAKLAALPARLREGLSLRPAVESLVNGEAAGADRIAAVHQLAVEAVQAAEAELAALVGLKAEGAPPPSGLADALTTGVATLSKPIEELFPTLAALRPERLFEPGSDGSVTSGFDAALTALRDFEERTAAKIAGRLAWWKEESAEGSKLSLLIQAAAYYEPADHRCPVCEQSISDLPVEGELERLKGASVELRASLRVLFHELADELRVLIPPAFWQWRRLSRERGSAMSGSGSSVPSGRHLRPWSIGTKGKWSLYSPAYHRSPRRKSTSCQRTRMETSGPRPAPYWRPCETRVAVYRYAAGLSPTWRQSAIRSAIA